MSALDNARADIEREIGKHRRHIAEGTSIGGEPAEWHETCIAALLSALAIINVNARAEAERVATILPFCDCGSVDKYGDDLGEHDPRCPYHLAVLRISPILSVRELDELCRRTLRAMAASA